MVEIFTIEGKIKNHNYQFRIKPNLSMINFVEAMEKLKKKFSNQNFLKMKL